MTYELFPSCSHTVILPLPWLEEATEPSRKTSHKNVAHIVNRNITLHKCFRHVTVATNLPTYLQLSP